MFSIDKRAMEIPRTDLYKALEERIEKKNVFNQKNDEKFGKDRTRIFSTLENIALPELFGFDMNDFLNDPALQMEMTLRERIFYLDNLQSDNNQPTSMKAHSGIYTDMTVLGLEVTHDPDGVPQYGYHPISDRADLSLMKPFDFFMTGDMPRLHKIYTGLKNLSQEWYGGKIDVSFPTFFRGPLDIYVQMRGYENFVTDLAEDTDFVHAFLGYIARERIRWNKERISFLGGAMPYDTYQVDDDWVYVPFISPNVFNEFIFPTYKVINHSEPITHFHTCGDMVPFAHELLNVFPSMTKLAPGGWCDFERLDAMVDPSITFSSIGTRNIFTLFSTDEEQRERFAAIKRVAHRRKVNHISVAALTKTHITIEETIYRANQFIDKMREAIH